MASTSGRSLTGDGGKRVRTTEALPGQSGQGRGTGQRLFSRLLICTCSSHHQVAFPVPNRDSLHLASFPGLSWANTDSNQT